MTAKLPFPAFPSKGSFVEKLPSYFAVDVKRDSSLTHRHACARIEVQVTSSCRTRTLSSSSLIRNVKLRTSVVARFGNSLIDERTSLSAPS